jgi:methionyl-tRNA synthetase
VTGTDAKPLLVTATAPTPNGALHLGHLSGPYVAADIAVRAARAAGTPVLAVGGVDPHQNYVVTRAEKAGQPAGRVAEEYSGLIAQAWQRGRVGYDVFVDPANDPAYRRGVSGLLTELVDRKAVDLADIALYRCVDCGRTMHHAYVSGRCGCCGQPANGGTCEGCGSYLLAGDLVDAMCGCGGRPVTGSATLPVLRLERYRQELTAMWSAAVLTPRVRQLVGRYITEGLPDVPLAYPTDWGIATDPHLGEDLRVDVWSEMGLGYLHAIGAHLDPAAGDLDGYRRAWEQAGPLWHFLGIDNAFYYAVLFPALAIAAQVPGYRLGGMVVNEFYRLDGKKFSTSRDHAIWAHEALSGDLDPGLARMYLSWDRPDRYQSDFTHAGLSAFAGYLAAARHRGADGRATVPDVFVDQELTRARHALRLASFDPGLALRCLLLVLPYQPERARPLLELIAGGCLPATAGDEPSGA